MIKRICSFLMISIFAASMIFAERPLVKDIQAKVGKGNKVKITWTLPKKPEPELTALHVYRTTEQITSYKKIFDEKLEPIAKLKPETSGCIDTLSDFKDYFYTIISETTEGIYDIVLVSFNSTVTSVHLIAKKAAEKEVEQKESETVYPDGSLRKTPLPFLDMLEGFNSEPLISDTIAKKTETLTGGAAKASKTEMPSPYIFDDDLVSPDSGDAYFLFEILKTSFVKKDYKETIEKLTRLVGTNISEETRNRAYFYLGESQFFNRNYEEAVRSFVKVQAAFPTLSQKWLEASLDRI